jgi:four helix bundle protein
MASGVKDLKLWQESVALAGDVVRTAKQSTRRETQVFTDQLIDSAVAIGASIAHGYASYAPDEQRLAYQNARRALLELETRLAIARHAGLMPPAVLLQLTGRLTIVGRLLSGYVGYIDRQLADTGRAITPLDTGTSFPAAPGT